MADQHDVDPGSLRGMPVQNLAGDELGRIQEIAVDSHCGRVVYVIVAPHAAGQEERRVPIPWRVLRLQPDGDAVVMNVYRAALRSAPTFKLTEWPDFTDPRFESQIRKYYGYAPRSEGNLQRPVGAAPYVRRRAAPRRRVGSIAIVLFLLALTVGVFYVVTTVGWSSAPASIRAASISVKDASEDVVTTVKVRAALALSRHVSVFDIGVDTRDRMVTLTGTVPSEAIKRLAGDIAEQTTGVGEVRNEILVDPSAKPVSAPARQPGQMPDLETGAPLTSPIGNRSSRPDEMDETRE
jgi:sporulation protein YlmC with PRC-barrel domain